VGISHRALTLTDFSFDLFRFNWLFPVLRNFLREIEKMKAVNLSSLRKYGSRICRRGSSKAVRATLPATLPTGTYFGGFQ
jgi:hypothetical protein